jgi:hypothetical protein
MRDWAKQILSYMNDRPIQKNWYDWAKIMSNWANDWKEINNETNSEWRLYVQTLYHAIRFFAD